GLPGAVLAHEGVDLSREEPERHAVERPDPGEPLRDSGDLKDGLAHDALPSLAGAAAGPGRPARPPRSAGPPPRPGRARRRFGSVLAAGKGLLGGLLVEDRLLGDDAPL